MSKDSDFKDDTTPERSETRKIHRFFDLVALLAQKKTGIQFLGKDVLIRSRLQRRLRELSLQSFPEYMVYFQDHQEEEISEVVSLLTTHKTSFFREKEQFDYLKMHVFPKFISEGRKIRIWSAGVSSGEEAYSIAITFLESLRISGKLPSAARHLIEIVGTDIDLKSIQTANEGIYSIASLKTVDPALLDRYFEKGKGDLSDWARVKDEVWRLCTFRVGNILDAEEDLGVFDIVLIRNVMIYFSKEAIQTALRQIQSHLKDDGWLLVGLTENLSGYSIPQSHVGKSVYRKSEKILPSAQVGVSPRFPKFNAIRVLIVDDSATIRKLISKILDQDSGFEVVGEASHPIEADKILKEKKVDVITLDIQMPYMDGVTYLKKIQKTDHPPIVMVSTLGFEEAGTGLKCLELGAVDYLQKPSQFSLDSVADEFKSIVRAAVSARRDYPVISNESSEPLPSLKYSPTEGENALICIGASAGGPVALQSLLKVLPENAPPVLLVQHLPKFFTTPFAKKLAESCKMRIAEAVHDELIESGRVYIAPGGKQMGITRRSKKFYISLTSCSEALHCPSVDHLFSSVAEYGKYLNISAAILTGMGRDGSLGMKELLNAGAYTIAQNEETSVVYGMPKAALEEGAVMDTLPLQSIAQALLEGLQKNKQVA